MAKLSMTAPKVKTYDDENERKAAAVKAAAPSLTSNPYLDDVVGPVFDQIALKKKALDLITDPHAPAGFKVSNYLDSMAQSGAMDADTKAAYEAEKTSKLLDPKKQAQQATAIAVQKERALEDYLASDERKQKPPVTAPVQTDSPMGDLGAFIGQSLFNKAKTGSFTGDETEGKLRTEADYYKNLSGQLLDRDTMEKDLAALDSWPQQDKRDLQTLYIHKGNLAGEAAGFPVAGATSVDALAARSRLQQKYGAEAVDHILESYSRSQNAAFAQEAAKAGRENHGLLDTAVSIPLGIVGGVSSALSQGSQALADTLGLTSGRYQTTDPNTPADILSIYTDAVKAGGAEEFGKYAEATAAIHGADENTSKAVGALASTAYQAGISTLDNLAKIALTGGTGTLVLAGTQSFSSAMRAAAANGASPQQAAAMGLVSAASEILTEKLPLDNLLGNLGKATKVSDFGAIVLASLKQAGIEVTTEELNLITGIAAEALILREKSDYRKSIADMVASGVPYAEARSQANAAILRQAGQTALQSGLSGFMTSAGTSAAAQVAPANRFTEAAQEYDSQKQSATDRLSGLLDGILPQRKQTPAQATPTPSQAKEQSVIDLVDEAIATATGAPADPLRAAVDSFRQTGTVTNKQVTDILNNTRAVQKLVQETNLKLDGLTASQKRQNVKAAISAITRTEQVDTVQNTDYDNIITQGGNLHGTEPTAQTYDERGSEAGALGVPGRGQASETDRSGISGTVGEAGERTPEVYLPERQQELTSGKNRYRQEDYYTPERGSALEQTQHSFSNEYGIECRVVKDSAWVEESPAYTDGEKVYIRESIDPATLSTAVPHESTHMMKRLAFRPYLDFADSTPDFLNMDNKTAALRLLDMAAKHRRMDAFNNTDADMRHIYDELNALVYGIQKSGIIQDGQYDFSWVPDAFLDFDGYIQQLDSIHEQYRTQAKTAKATAPNESVGAAPAWFDPNTRLQYEHGTIPDGENPVRPDDLPVRDYTGGKVSYTARSVKGAEATPDEFIDLLNKETVEGGLSYVPITNNETTQKAIDYIKAEGWEAAKAKWEENVRTGKAGADLSAQGALLLNNAARAGDKTAWLDILHTYQTLGTNTAQGLQALRILKKLAPDDKLYMIKRSVQQMVKDMHLDTQIELDEQLTAEFENAETDEARDAALKKIQKDVAAQIPSTFMDKFTALRYVNMLGNLRTQGRNIVGNLGMKGVRSVQNTVAAGIENIVSKASGGKLRRTRSATVSKAQRAAAAKDFDLLKSAILGGGKYADTASDSSAFSQGVQEQRQIFKFKPLEGYRKVTNWAMEQGDLIFAKDAYARALAGYLKANGIMETDYSRIDTAILDDARLFAAKEAQEATFRDTNWLSGWISKVGRRKDTPGIVKTVSEGIMPFRKTPANVLVRAEEYSPLGIVNSLTESVLKIAGNTKLVENRGILGKIAKKGQQITGAQVINSWAKTLTGTGLFGLGILLQNLGLLTAGGDDDEKKDEFESMNGWQNYAITLPDGTNFTIDFLSPSAMPMLMGAQFMQLVRDGGFSLKDIESALTSLAEPMVQMSMLQGVNDTLENIQYAENNLGQMLINSGISYLTQVLTNTLAGQIERTFEGERMTTYVDKGSALPDWLQRAIGKASAKTPGWDYSQIPYINAWGEEEQNPAWFWGGIYNTLSPAYIEKGVSNELTEELNRLNDALSDVNVYPSAPDRSVTFNKTVHNLSAEEYVSLAKTQGQKQRRLVEDILAVDAYAALTDEEKAKAIRYAYDYARDYARGEVLDGHPGITTKWMAGLAGNIADGIVRYVATGTVEKYTSLPIEKASYIDDLLDSILPPAGKNNATTQQKIAAVTSDGKLTDKEQQTVLKDVLRESDYDKFLQILKLGYSNDDYADSYRIYAKEKDTGGKGTKARTIAAFQKEFGISEAAATALYEVYNPK